MRNDEAVNDEPYWGNLYGRGGCSILAIQHENGDIHIRTNDMSASLVVRALHDAGLDFGFEDRLTNEDGDEVFGDSPEGTLFFRVLDIWTEPPVTIEQVALALVAVSQNAFAYEVCYDGNGEPDTKYRLVGPVERENDPGMLFMFDYGFYNGTWLIGAYQMIEMALEKAKRAGVEILHTDTQDGHITAAAIPSESQGPIIKALRALGVQVKENIFRPSDYWDRNRDDPDAVDDFDDDDDDFDDDDFGPKRHALALPGSSMVPSRSAGSATDEPADVPANAPAVGEYFDTTVRCDRCNAQGQVQAWVAHDDTTVCLTFCLHHYREVQATLAEKGAVIDDRSGQF